MPRTTIETGAVPKVMRTVQSPGRILSCANADDAQAGTWEAQMQRVALVALLVALGASACGGTKPELHMPTDAKVGVAMGSAAYDEPRSVGSMSLCLTSPGTATITRVALHQPSGDIRVEAFALRSNPFARGLDGLGIDSKPLAEIGAGFDPGGAQEVSMVCPTDAQMNDATITAQLDEFGVQVAWSSGDVSGGTGLDVTYRVDGAERTALIPFAIWLCASACPENIGAK